MTYAALQPTGKRLRTVEIGGHKLVEDQHYTFAGCERDGEPLDMVCRMGGVHDVSILPIKLHAGLLKYLVKHPVIAPKRDGRSRAVDLPERVFSQDHVLNPRDED